MPHFALQSKNVIVNNNGNSEMLAACVEVKNQLIHAIHPYNTALSCQVHDYDEHGAQAASLPKTPSFLCHVQCHVHVHVCDVVLRGCFHDEMYRYSCSLPISCPT